MNAEFRMDGEQDSSYTNNKGRSRSRSPLGGNENSRHSSPDRSSRNYQSNRGSRIRAPTSRSVYVANIPYGCRWTMLKDLFKEKVGDVSYVKLFEDNGKFRGCGIVELKDASSVQKAVDVLHRYEFHGRQLVVKEDFDVDRDKTGRPLRRSGGANIDPVGFVTPQYNTYGVSPQLLNSLGITGPLTSRLFVANLDYKVTLTKLEEVFALAGKVVKIELKKDEKGNSKGYGTIEMGHPVEAVQAISMFNGQKFFNRTMTVKMDKIHKDDPEEKRLPEGLKNIGKGLGANGIALKFPNESSSATGLTAYGMAPVGEFPRAATNNLDFLQSNPMTTGIGMGFGLAGADRGNFGLTGVSQHFGLESTAASAGMTNAQIIGAGLNHIANGAAGLNTLGLNTSLVGGIGLASNAARNAGVGSGSLGGYQGYERLDGRGDDSYYRSRSDSSMRRKF